MREENICLLLCQGKQKGYRERGRGGGGRDVEREYICTYNEITKHERNCNTVIYTSCVVGTSINVL